MGAEVVYGVAEGTLQVLEEGGGILRVVVEGNLNLEDRITSYNVCYTKLLRVQSGRTGIITVSSRGSLAFIIAT